MGSGPLSGSVREGRHHPDKREVPTPAKQFLLQPELGWTAEGETDVQVIDIVCLLGRLFGVVTNVCVFVR